MDTLKQNRQKKRLTQAQVAEMTGIRRGSLSEYETGKRFPDSGDWSKLEALLGPLPPERQLDYASSELLRPFQRRGREYRYRPPRDRETIVRVKAAWRKFPSWLKELRETLDRDYPHLEEAVVDSALELLCLLRLSSFGAKWVHAAPQLLGFDRYPIVDQPTGALVGHRRVPALVWKVEELTVALVPQVSLKNQRSWRVDLLVGLVKPGQPVVWMVLEVDGRGHDASCDPDKEADLAALPFLRLNTADLCRRDLRDRLLQVFHEAFLPREIAKPVRPA